MKYAWIPGGIALLLAFCLTSPALAFGTKDVLQMQRDGISDQLIIEKIEHSGKVFRLDADDLRELKQAGVSDKVITSMLRTEDREDDYTYYHPRSRVFVDLGFYGGTYYRPCGYYPRYRHYGTWGYGGYGGHGYYPRHDGHFRR